MIAILGTGTVASALARSFARTKDAYCFGSRDASGPGSATTYPVAEAIRRSSLVVLALPFAAAVEVARQTVDWNSRIVIDCTNPLAPALEGLSIGGSTSGAETIADAANNARVVKAFSTIGAEFLADPTRRGASPFLPVSGDDPEAVATVVDLATRMGFDAASVGGLREARLLEPHALLWIRMAMKLGFGRDFAFVRSQ